MSCEDYPCQEIPKSKNLLVDIAWKIGNKTVYALGETVNTSGLEVTAHYSDGSAKIVSDYDVSSVDILFDNSVSS